MRYLNETPSTYVRSVRVRTVHEALLKASPTQQVSEILLQCGVTSFGHFSRAYKQAYGCTPSEILKRNQSPRLA